MRLVKSLITGSVALGILIAGGAGVAAVNFSSSLASDHSIVVQREATQSGDTRNGTDDVIADDRTSPSSESNEPNDDRNGTSHNDDPAAASDDKSNDSAPAAAPRTSDDSTHKRGDAPTQPTDDDGSDK